VNEKPPQPTSRIVTRLRRHARSMRRVADSGAARGPFSQSNEALSAMSHTAWQAAQRLEDLEEGRELLEGLVSDLFPDQQGPVFEYLERVGGGKNPPRS
jgi:hypothetical protein